MQFAVLAVVTGAMGFVVLAIGAGLDSAHSQVLFDLNSQFRVIKRVGGGAVQLLEQAMEVDLTETEVLELRQVDLRTAQVTLTTPKLHEASPFKAVSGASVLEVNTPQPQHTHTHSHT